MPDADQRFSKTSRLLRRAQFDLVFESRQKVSDGKLVIFWRANELGFARLGLVISTAYGNAVARNRLKRRLRELFRKTAERPALDLVVLPSKQGEAKTADMTGIAKSWSTLLEKISRHSRHQNSDTRGGDKSPTAP